MKTTARGRQAEQACSEHLQRQGLKPVTNNYRTRRGEIDLVMRDGETLVFIEVRYRQRDDFGSAIESVGSAKQHRIIGTARHYITQHDIGSPVRIDVVGVTRDSDGNYEFEWIRNAISE